MFKAIKVRLYPNQKQSELLAKNAGSARFVFNHFLALRIEEYKSTGKSPSRKELSSELTWLKQQPDFKWLQEVDSTSLQQVLINLDQTYTNFFRRVKQGGPPGFPRFKRKGVRDSFRCVMSLAVEENYLKIGKHGWIKFRGNEDLLNSATKIKSITVSLDAGHWYASCLTEVEELGQHIHQHSACGIDLGVKQPLTVVYETEGGIKTKVLGKKFSNALEVKEARRKKYQRALARKQLGSQNRLKAKLKVQRAYQKERNLRKDWIEKTSTQLANRFELVVFEDLKLQQMTKNGGAKKNKLNDGMRRLGLSRLVARTEQKSLAREGNVVYIYPAYTSQACNACGSISKQNRKSQAVFCCIYCGNHDNADRNAALNILDLGLRQTA